MKRVALGTSEMYSVCPESDVDKKKMRDGRWERKRGISRVGVQRGQHHHNKQSSVRSQSLLCLNIKVRPLHCRPAPLFPMFPGPKYSFMPCARRRIPIVRSLGFPRLSSYKPDQPRCRSYTCRHLHLPATTSPFSYSCSLALKSNPSI